MYCIRVSIPSVFIFNIILSSRSVRRRLLSMFIIYNQERWKNFNFGFYFASTSQGNLKYVNFFPETQLLF